jgi:uncharacterized protein with NRDE domain
MCVIAWYWQPGEPRLLSLWANRDEWFSRPSQALSPWPERPTWVGGRDLRAHGSWLLVDTDAHRLAALTNVRSARAEEVLPSAPSRGSLVAKVLEAGRVNPADLEPEKYPGFNLLLIDWRAGTGTLLTNRLGANAGRGVVLRSLGYGAGSISNGHPDTAWPKQQRLLGALEAARSLADEAWIRAGWSALSDRWVDPARSFAQPETGGLSERALAAVFVDTAGYGTRQSSLLQVDAKGRAVLRERTWHRDRASGRGTGAEGGEVGENGSWNEGLASEVVWNG